MAVVYNTTLKNTRMTDVVAAIGATGKLIIGTAGMGATLATLDLSAIAGTVAGGVLTFNPITSTIASGTGTAEEATITDGASDVVTGLTVGVSGANVNLSSVLITTGDSVAITSGTITHG